MNSLTLCYVTFRNNPKFEWWADSLIRQLTHKHDYLDQIKRIVVVAFKPSAIDADALWRLKARGLDVLVTKPMPSVWQGEHRLTKADYFAASNARNTGICLAPTSHICFADDLSVLMPTWLDQVMEALNSSDLQNKVICGAYRKVNKMQVEYGVVKLLEDHPPGNDQRLRFVQGDGPHPCDAQWAYGCSIMFPMEALLTVNGYDTDCDGMGYEDTVTGKMVQARGYHFVFAPRMMTYESEELHHDESNPRFLRADPGKSPNDKSHAILNLVKSGRNYAPNYYGDGGIRALRLRILSAEPFPVIQVPQHDWFTGQPLSELPQ